MSASGGFTLERASLPPAGRGVQRAATRQTPEERRAIQLKFLEGLRLGWSISRAANFAGTARSTVFSWRRADSSFAVEWEDAYEEGTDHFEDAVQHRAEKGWDDPVFHGGKQVGARRLYSDSLVKTMLEGRRPEKYRERAALEAGDSTPGADHLTAARQAELDPADADALARVGAMMRKEAAEHGGA